MNLTAFYQQIDPWLILFYRISGYALLDYFIGREVNMAVQRALISSPCDSLAFLAGC